MTTPLVNQTPAPLAAASPKRPYLAAGRLADVFALIQVLALHDYAHRSESGLLEVLQRGPSSAPTWTEVARQHPEFFRVRPTGENVVSLLARHVSRREEEGRPPLDAGQVKELLASAVTLHDRQVDQSRAWRIWLPLIGVLVGAGLTALASFLR